METLLFTLEKRPYVFAFLLAFLIIGCLTRGWKRTFLFLFSGYLIAWGSEALSIRTGFPYGWYFYIYENLKGEWMNLGVPVWDSLSYTFLCFAGLSVAEYLTQTKWKIILLSALFVVILDIVVDPLAHLGDKWFLGKIYYYPHPGWYFNVPVSNFIGWFFVAALIIGLNLLVEGVARLKGAPHRAQQFGARWGMKSRQDPFYQIISHSGLFLYFGIFLFNLGITIWIKEWKLVIVDLLWISLPLILVLMQLKRNVESRCKENHAEPVRDAPLG